MRLSRATSPRSTATPAGEVTGAAVCDPGAVPEPSVANGQPGLLPVSPAVEPEPATLSAGAAENWIAPTWEQVVRDHSARVYRLAYRLSGNQQDAEDLTQDTFVRVFRSLADFSPGTFEGWLHRITTNLFLDMVRRRQRIRFDALPEDTERLPGAAPSPEQVYVDTHLDPQVQAALDALSPEFRVAVVLCDIEGLTYEEIAATLGIKLGTVRSRIHRGRVQLREALAHLAPNRGRAPVTAP
ncbi:MAG TPA: RNA polymerase sigma factor SigE [Modestobacter sp.]|nr:RNA polymerase sigma factor SigE [Modestobacter sp.]